MNSTFVRNVAPTQRYLDHIHAQWIPLLCESIFDPTSKNLVNTTVELPESIVLMDCKRERSMTNPNFPISDEILARISDHVYDRFVSGYAFYRVGKDDDDTETFDFIVATDNASAQGSRTQIPVNVLTVSSSGLISAKTRDHTSIAIATTTLSTFVEHLYDNNIPVGLPVENFYRSDLLEESQAA
ncbi:MAG: hypothetical protein ACYDA1_02495 [Vulcanimicrobiaceae bacterium]